MLGKKKPCSAIRLPVAREVLGVRHAEALDLGRLLPVGADDADARERFLGDGADIGELRLDLLEAPVNRAAEDLHRDRHERQRDQRQERQPRVDRQHHGERDRRT